MNTFSRYCCFLIILIGLGFSSPQVLAQTSDSARHYTGRKWMIGGIQAGLWAGTFHALNKAWYANYPKERFHFFDDSKEWMQMDKLGHVWTTYQISRASASSWEWAGFDHKKAVLLGAASGIAFQSIIEILDGYSEKWGFSGYDMLANFTGAGMFALTEMSKKPHLVTMKLSYSPVDYAADHRSRAIELFGSSPAGRLLKDYNGQTYWLSFNVKSIFPETSLPGWLNIALGHGARTMLGGHENIWIDKNGSITDASHIVRERRLYLSLDIDLTKIPTRKKWLKTTFSLFNCLKVPAPALEFSTSGNWKIHPIHY